MPDISLCANSETNGCTLKSKCRRFLDKPSEYQSYSNFDFYAGSCNHFWEVETMETIRENFSEQQKENYKDLHS